jgi:hypothetical protein
MEETNILDTGSQGGDIAQALSIAVSDFDLADWQLAHGFSPCGKAGVSQSTRSLKKSTRCETR